MRNSARYHFVYHRTGEFDVEYPRGGPYLGKREGIPMGWGLVYYRILHGNYQSWVKYLHVAAKLVNSEASRQCGLVHDMVGEYLAVFGPDKHVEVIYLGAVAVSFEVHLQTVIVNF